MESQNESFEERLWNGESWKYKLDVVGGGGGREGGRLDRGTEMEMVMKSSMVSEEGGNVEGEEQEGEYDEVLRRDGERDQGERMGKGAERKNSGVGRGGEEERNIWMWFWGSE